jgi:hypothetical protein
MRNHVISFLIFGMEEHHFVGLCLSFFCEEDGINNCHWCSPDAKWTSSASPLAHPISAHLLAMGRRIPFFGTCIGINSISHSRLQPVPSTFFPFPLSSYPVSVVHYPPPLQKFSSCITPKLSPCSQCRYAEAQYFARARSLAVCTHTRCDEGRKAPRWRLAK